MRHFLKKGIAALLSAVMVVTAVPQLAKEVHAAENQLPTKEQFATVEELKSFNTNDTDGEKNPAKVYFGNNSQQWWIAGSQQDKGLTLFAASSLATEQEFEPNRNQNKQYSADWKCNYTSTGGSNPTEVYPNHYGASPLRTTLQGLETSYFTKSEQALMNNTTIYTNDTKNNSVYSTTNKLYLAYGDSNDNQYITVGANSEDSLNNGLRVDKSYWHIWRSSWLRAPHLNYEYKFFALIATPYTSVAFAYANVGYALVPAFELNLSPVLFASAAPAASSDGNLTLQDTDGDGAFTLRYKSDALGSALVSYDKSKVTLTNIPNGTYLVVQNSSGAKAKQITNETEVSASSMGLDSFANCKVWLETTDAKNRMTYAALATEEGPAAEVNGVGYSSLKEAVNNCPEDGVITLLKDVVLVDGDEIKINKNCTLNLKDNKIFIPYALIVIEKNASVTIVTGDKGDIKALQDESYSVYIKGDLKVIGSLNCVVFNAGTISDGVFNNMVINVGTIEGGYFSHVHNYSNGIIQGGYFKEELENNQSLPEGYFWIDSTNSEYPYKILKEDKVNQLNITLGNGLKLESGKLDQVVEKNSPITPITIKVNDGYYLSEEYIRSISDLSGLTIMLNENNNGLEIHGTPKSNVNVKLPDASKKKDGDTVVKVPTGLSATYKEGLKLSEIVLPADSGWSWVNGDTVLSAGTKSYRATFDTMNLESTTDFSKVEGYDANIHKVTRDVQVEVKKADSAVTITTQSLDKVYDGNVVTDPEYTTSGSDGKVTIKWQENTSATDTPVWKDLDTAPSTVGTYRVVVELAGNNNYNSASATSEFAISQTQNTWTEKLSIEGWTYNDKVNTPTAKAQFGDVTFTYSSEENGEYTNEVPENAGTYYVKATVAGTENYTGLESIVSFTIAKADTTLTFEKDNIDKIYDKNAISEPKVSKTGSSNDVVFTWFVANGADWKQLENAPSDVGTYKVVASVTEDTNYNGTSIEKEFAITKSDSDIQVTLDKSEYTYGDTLIFNINVDLKSDSNLSTRLLQQETVALYLGEQKLSEDVKLENKKAVVTFDTTKTDQLGELDKDFTFTIKYEGDNNLDVSSKDITVPIHKKSTEITNINDLSKTYDGKVISELTYDINHKESEVQVTYQQFIGDKYEKIETSIVNTGSYRVILTSPATDHYSACEVTKEFEITSSDSDIVITSDKDTYVYEDQITLDVSVNLTKKLSFFERLLTNDNTVIAYVGDTAISSSVELDKNNHATLTIDTKDEKVRKVLKPSDKKLTITVKYNGSENLNNTKNDISIMLYKKDTTVSFKDTAFNLNREYNGKAVTVDVEKDIHKTENAPEVTLKWNAADGTALDTAPLKVGKYQLIVSIPEDAYYNGSSVQHDFEISKAELSVEVKVKDKQYDGFNTAEIDTAALVGVAEGDQITLINGIPTFDSVEVGENIAIHFTEFTLEAEEDVLNNYTLIQPTGVTANITNTWIPKKDVEYTTSQPNDNGWVKEDFKIQAKEGYLLAFGNKADGSRSTNWSKELAGSEEGANSIVFYVKNEQTGAISTQVTEQYQLDKTKPEVNGLEEDKVYCKEITFTVEETNLDVVKANEKELTPNEKGVYTLTAGNHQITVRDQAGNETVLAVTVNAEHTPNADDGDCTTPVICTVCGMVVKEAQEHSFTTYTSDSNAGCLTDGTKTAECDHEGCKQTKTVADEGSALGHDWGEWETITSPDCENKGSEKRTCKRCSITETKDLDANGHDWEEEFTVDQEATCTQEGSKSIHCKNCDAVKDSTSIPATGHAYGEPKWNWSGDGKTATGTFTCQNDSSHVETKKADVTSAVKEPATCTQEGITTYTATVTFEGNVYTDTKDVADIGALGHDWEEEYTIDQEATCTEEGSKSIHCKNCDATKDSTVIPATGHAYGEPKWSWSEDGKAATITFICQNDSGHVETKAAEITSTVKEPATCTKEGTTTYTAIVTFEGNVYTDTKDVTDIAVLAHEWEEDFTIDQEATCTEEGSKSIHCKNCDATKDSMVIPATGHEYVHGVCTVCGWKDPNYQEYEVGGGSGSSWNKGDENGLSVQTPGEIGKVTDVTLNGKPLVEGTDYVVNDGTVILKPNVLEELKEGNHTLTIYGEKGYVETQIKIEKNTTPAPQKPGSPENKDPNQGTGIPETGDSANLGLWFALLFISIGGVSGTYFYKKKKSN